MVAANFLQAEDKFGTAALVGARSGGLIPNAAALIATAFVAAFGRLSLEIVLAIQLLAYFASLAIAAIAIAAVLRRPVAGPRPAADSALPPGPYNARWFLFESWPNLLNQLIAVVLTEGDLLWIACFANVETVASYGVIRNLRLLVAAPLMVVSVALPPFVAELYSRRDLVRLERLIRGAATAISVPSLMVLAVLLLAPEAVLRLTAGPDFVSAAVALQVVVVGSCVFVLSGSNGMTLTMTGRHRDLLVCGIGGLALYVLISPPLVMRYGVLGAAIAYTLQVVAVNVATTLRARQVVGIWTIPLLSWRAVRDEAALVLRQLRSRR
jgi:O-antigen/teichoic acid export membrane protein